MNKRFPKATILEVLRRVELGTPLRELRREYGFSEPTYYYWRAKYHGVQWGNGRSYSDLEAENRRLKILLAEAILRFAQQVSGDETDSANVNSLFKATATISRREGFVPTAAPQVTDDLTQTPVCRNGG